MIIADFKVCKGINNRDKSYRLSPSVNKYEVLEATNFDITNRGSLVKRGAVTQVNTGNYDYLYNFKGKLCYVKDGVFYFNDSPLIGVTGKVAYATNNESLFVMDATSIYKVADNGNYQDITSGDGDGYYQPPKAGHLITYAFGSLFIASNNRITYTMPFRFDTVDMRKNIMYLPSYIRMLIGTSAGIYVGDMDGVYFMTPAQDDGFTIRLLLPERVYKGSATEVNLGLISPELKGKGVLFVTESGLHVGTAEGEINNITPSYRFDEGKSATVRVEDGVYQYIYV